MRGRQRGTVVALWLLYCGLCDCEPHQSPGVTREQALAEARRLGWRHTRADGWLCSDCAREIEETRR
jgi:hypothetical protein